MPLAAWTGLSFLVDCMPKQLAAKLEGRFVCVIMEVVSPRFLASMNIFSNACYV